MKDARQELTTTLEQFAKEESASPQNQSLACRFPARLNVLKRFHPELQKIPSCSLVQQWKAGFKLESLHIIFASQFLSNPASIFGHTFLKLQSAEKKFPDFMNMVVGFAASIPPDTGNISYVVKGLTGGFPGNLTLDPMFVKVQEYNNMESRDLMEFKIRLTADQRDLFLDHLWELKNFGEFSYSFLHSNCSYFLLTLLEALNPKWQLTKHFHLYVAPQETIKILDYYNLIDSDRFRPSLERKLVARYLSLSKVEQAQVEDTLSDSIKKIPENSQVLDTLIDFLNFNKYENKGNLSSQETEQLNRIIAKRATLGSKEVSPKIDGQSGDILESHHPMMLATGSYFTSDRKTWKQKVIFRPAMHSLEDLGTGYLKNTEAKLAELEVSMEWRKKTFSIDRFTVADIGNFPAYLFVNKHPSWRGNIELSKIQDTENIDHYSLNFNPEFGLSHNLFSPQDLLSVLVINKTEISNYFQRFVRLGIGFKTSYIWDISEHWKTIQSHEIVRYFFQPRIELYQRDHSLSFIYSPNKTLAFETNGKIIRGKLKNSAETNLMMKYYF